jgi:hypothetical protein
MNYKMRACRIEGEGAFGRWSIYDLKTGHEFFRGKFNGGNERHIFGYVACFATLYDTLKLDIKLSGQDLMQTFAELSQVVHIPCPGASMRLHGEDANGREIDIDL